MVGAARVVVRGDEQLGGRMLSRWCRAPGLCQLLQYVMLDVHGAQDGGVRAPGLVASVGPYQPIACYKVIPAPV